MLSTFLSTEILPWDRHLTVHGLWVPIRCGRDLGRRPSPRLAGTPPRRGVSGPPCAHAVLTSDVETPSLPLSRGDLVRRGSREGGGGCVCQGRAEVLRSGLGACRVAAPRRHRPCFCSHLFHSVLSKEPFRGAAPSSSPVHPDCWRSGPTPGDGGDEKKTSPVSRWCFLCQVVGKYSIAKASVLCLQLLVTV